MSCSRGTLLQRQCDLQRRNMALGLRHAGPTIGTACSDADTCLALRACLAWHYGACIRAFPCILLLCGGAPRACALPDTVTGIN